MYQYQELTPFLSTHQPDMSIKLKYFDTKTRPVEIGDRERGQGTISEFDPTVLQPSLTLASEGLDPV
jgi:hypothetical protein